MQTDVHDISNVVVVVIQDLSPSISHSSFLSSFLPILDSCHRHYTFSRPSSSLSANRMKIALSEKFKYGHATPQRDRMDGGEGAVRKRKGGGGRGPFANENSLYLPKWRSRRCCCSRYKDTMAPAPAAAAITHITTYEGQRGTDAGRVGFFGRVP